MYIRSKYPERCLLLLLVQLESWKLPWKVPWKVPLVFGGTCTHSMCVCLNVCDTKSKSKSEAHSSSIRAKEQAAATLVYILLIFFLLLLFALSIHMWCSKLLLAMWSVTLCVHHLSLKWEIRLQVDQQNNPGYHLSSDFGFSSVPFDEKVGKNNSLFPLFSPLHTFGLCVTPSPSVRWHIWRKHDWSQLLHPSSQLSKREKCKIKEKEEERKEEGRETCRAEQGLTEFGWNENEIEFCSFSRPSQSIVQCTVCCLFPCTFLCVHCYTVLYYESCNAVFTPLKGLFAFSCNFFPSYVLLSRFVLMSKRREGERERDALDA